MSTTGFEQSAADAYPTRSSPQAARLDRPDPVVWGTEAAGPLSAVELQSYDERGYLQIENIIDEAELATCRDELRRLSADPAVRADERTVVEPASQEVRSVFEVHTVSDVFARLVADPRVAGRARQILGSEVYVHQSRVNYKPGFRGKEFYWHSDFETWHAEDGMPRMRAVSISIALTENYASNGPLMIMPGSQRTFVSCVGETPEDHYQDSLQAQRVGTPDDENLFILAERHGVDVLTGDAAGATIFDCNCMHGSSGNITPFPRSNVFIVFNSVENTLVQPYAAPVPRPPFVASRTFEPVG